jgi:hypothetical protein
MTPEDAGNAEVKLENTVLEGKEGKDPIGQALPLLQEAQQATKGQIAATNAAQADAAVAEQMQPINQAVDFLDLYNQRQAAELAREKEKEDKRIRWERLGHDIASIAASVGDMTRASEGAPVSPRDWQQTYDNLSAQARANIDNYRVRMAKIHEDEKAARMAQAQAQAKAIGDRQKQDFDIKKLMLELGWKGDQASFERALKIFLNERNNALKESENLKYRELQKDLEEIRQQGRESAYHSKLLAASDPLNYNGKVYYYPKGTFQKIAQDINGIIRKHGENLKLLQGIENFKKPAELEIALREYLQSDEIKKVEGLESEILKVLEDNSINQQYAVMRELDSSTIQQPAGGSSNTGGYQYHSNVVKTE